MTTVDPNQGDGGAPASEEPKEPTEPQEPDAPNSDPLDAIEDEAARAEAKKHRAIARRAEKGGEQFDEEGNPVEEKPTEPTAPESHYATKEDLARIAMNDAKQLVSEEVREAWDDLKGIQLGGFDSGDPESIAKNMTQRYAVYREENPDDPEDHGLDTSPKVPKSGSGGKKTDPEKGRKDEIDSKIPSDDWLKDGYPTET